MADINSLIPFILKWEGGFSNDPADMGGATNKGITISTYEIYCRKKGLSRPTVNDLKNIPISHWRDIIKTMYWDRWRADEIHSQDVANILVDWLWTSGKHGITIPQRIVGVEPDGIVGTKTILAVNNYDSNQLLNAIYNERVKFLNTIVASSIKRYERIIGRHATLEEKMKHTNQRFLKGWMNRLNDIKNMRKK